MEILCTMYNFFVHGQVIQMQANPNLQLKIATAQPSMD